MRLGVYQRRAVYVTMTLVALSGVGWFVLHDLIEDEPTAWTRWLLILHGVAASAALVVLGSLLPVHARLGWLRSRHLVSGTTLVVTGAALAVTALALYYGGEETRLVARWIHIVVGASSILAFAIHVVLARGKRNRLRPTSLASATATSLESLSSDLPRFTG